MAVTYFFFMNRLSLIFSYSQSPYVMSKHKPLNYNKNSFKVEFPTMLVLFRVHSKTLDFLCALLCLISVPSRTSDRSLVQVSFSSLAKHLIGSSISSRSGASSWSWLPPLPAHQHQGWGRWWGRPQDCPGAPHLCTRTEN